MVSFFEDTYKLFMASCLNVLRIFVTHILLRSFKQLNEVPKFCQMPLPFSILNGCLHSTNLMTLYF